MGERSREITVTGCRVVEGGVRRIGGLPRQTSVGVVQQGGRRLGQHRGGNQCMADPDQAIVTGHGEARGEQLVGAGFAGTRPVTQRERDG
ncbi:MAG: hypothetical protein GC156_01290 [Actinomycetales bacterium]|nr:hypothetical protein [Actinomycetales bacterium]